MDHDQAIQALGSLAHPVRLQVFRALVVSGPSGLTPGVIQQQLDLPASTLSFHLKELAAAELVSIERASRHLVYRAVYDRMNGLISYLTENCCQGSECALPTTAAVCGC